MKKWLMMITAAATMSLVAACGDDNTEEAQEETAGEDIAGGQPEEMPEPDLEGVPDVVAEVEEEEITKVEFEQVYTSHFEQAAMMQQMSGEEVDEDELKQEVVEGMISNELLLQEADERGIEASEEDVDQLIAQLTEANGMESEQEFLDAMNVSSGMSEEDVRNELTKEVKIQQLISEEAGDVEPTEEEMQEAYDEQIAAREEAESEDGEETEAPEYEEVKPQIEEHLIREKESDVQQTLIEELREEADVTVHI